MDETIAAIARTFTGLLAALQLSLMSDDNDDAYWHPFEDQSGEYETACDWDWVERLHPADRELAVQTLAAARANSTAYDCEFRLQRADGQYRSFVARTKVCLNNGVCHWLGYCSDITGRITAERALHESVARSNAILNTALDSIILLDNIGHITAMNKAAETMFGYTEAQCIGQSMPTLLLETMQRESHQSGLLQYLFPTAGEIHPRRLEMMGRRADGIYFPIDIAVNSTNLQGTIWHTAYIRDISDAKAAELGLIESERRTRLIFENVAIGIVQTDLLGVYMRVNRAFCEMVGYSETELIGQTFHHVTHPDDWDINREDLLAMIRCERRTCITEKRYIHKSGAIIWTRLTMSMSYDGANRPEYCLAVIEDITAAKMLEAEHALLREQDRLLQEQADAMTRRLNVVQSITDTALAHLSVKELLPDLLDRIRAILEVDNIAILLLTEDKQFLTIYATRGVEESVADTLRIPIGAGLAGKIAVTRETLVIDDLSQVEVYNPLLHQHLKSLAMVPLIVEGRVIGVTHIGTIRQRHFNEEEMRLLTLMAERIALAIDHEQLFSAEQRAHARAVRHASEFEAIFEAIADGVCVYDAHGNVRRMNASALRLLGIETYTETQGSLEERSALYQLSNDDGKPLAQADWPMTRVLNGESAHADLWNVNLRNRNGERIYLAISGAPMRDDDGVVTGAVLIWHDVTTQRLLAQRTQHTLDALLQMAALLVGDEAIVLNDGLHDTASLLIKQIAMLARTILDCKMLALVAISPEGTTITGITTVGVAPDMEARWQAASQGKPLQTFLAAEVIAQLAAGEHAIVRFTEDAKSQHWQLTTSLLVPLYIDDRCIGILLVDFRESDHRYSTQEIVLANTVAKLLALTTEHERLLRQREHDLSTLQQLNEELALQNDQLQEVSQLKSEFLANMSHELRTPLNGIIGFTQMLQAEFIGPMSAKQKDILHDILASAKHLLYLINSILDLAKVEAGKIEFDIVAVNLPATMQEVINTLQPLLLQKQLHLVVTIDAAITTTMLDPAKLKQVLYNYLSNAIKFTPENGCITLITTLIPEGYFRVEVADTGIGIKAEDISRLFVEFQQLDAGHAKKYPGTGLGLALTKRIIQAQGGEVGIRSNVGKGSCFWFTLPYQAVA